MEGTPELLLCGDVTQVFKAAVICRTHPKNTCPGLALLTLQEVTAPVHSSQGNGIVLSSPRSLRSAIWFSPLTKGLQGLRAEQGWNVMACKGQIQMPAAAKGQDGSGSSFTGSQITALTCPQPKQDQNK